MTTIKAVIDLSKYTLQEECKAHCSHCHSRVLMLVQREEIISRRKSMSLGPFFYLCKKCGATYKGGRGGGQIAGPEQGR